MQVIAGNFAKQADEKNDLRIKSQAPDFFNETKFKEEAREFGEGVIYVFGSRITSEDFEGFKAVYSFGDINKVRIRQDAKNRFSSLPKGNGTNAPRKQRDITFSFSKGSPAELLIKIPVEQNGKEETATRNTEPASSGVSSEEAKALLAMMFKEMRISLYIDVDGAIVRTNASYKDGRRVTLLEVDFDKMIEKSDKLQKFSQSPPETLEKMRSLIKDFPGMKVELNNEVRVQFR